MDIAEIKERFFQGRFLMTRHASNEAANEDIRIDEIQEAVLAGQILESYPDTGRGESCLIVGITLSSNKVLHIVCGLTSEQAVIITVYIPQPPKFSDPWTRSSQ